MKLARILIAPLLAWGLATAAVAQTFPITDFEAFTAPKW